LEKVFRGGEKLVIKSVDPTRKDYYVLKLGLDPIMNGDENREVQLQTRAAKISKGVP
jgi:hypothetical protein